MIGVKVSMPNAPRLVIVNVPPCISSGRMPPLAGASGQVPRPRDDLAQPEPRRAPDHGDEQPLLRIHGDPDMRLVGDDQAIARPRRACSIGWSRSVIAASLTTNSR